MIKGKKSKLGVSLLEVVIAVMVTSIVIVGVLSLYYQSVLVTKKMNQLFIATNLAKSRLERIKNLEFDQLPFAEETDTQLDQNGNADLEGKFLRNTTISTNYNGNADLTSASVTVNFEVKGEWSTNPVTLTTVLVNE